MTVQELMNKIFGDKETMSKADILAGLENSGAKLADLAEGRYIDVNKHAAELRDREAAVRGDYEKKLAEKDAELNRFDGINPDDARKLPAEMDALKKTSAIRESLITHRARDIASVMPHIDKDKIVFDDDKKAFTGLDDQIEALVKDKPFLFDNGIPAGTKSSGTKSNGVAPGTDEIDDDKMRAAMGLPPRK